MSASVIIGVTLGTVIAWVGLFTLAGWLDMHLDPTFHRDEDLS